MAYLFTTNNTPATGVVLVFNFKTLLKSAGWTVKASGDGLSAYSSTADIITGSGSGANGLNNSNAWFRIQDPAAKRELVFQRGTATTVWKVKYSATDKFITGGSASVYPTSADEQFLIGTSGAFASWMGTDNTYRWSAGVNTTDGYGFWSVGTSIGNANGPTYSGVIILDPLAIGSFTINDVDPCVLYAASNATGILSLSTLQNSTIGMKSWFQKGTTNGAFTAAFPCSFRLGGTTTAIPNGVGYDQFTQKDVLFNIYYARPVSNSNSTTPPPYGNKGMGTLIRWGSTFHSNMTLLSIASNRDRITFGDITLPWNGDFVNI